MILNKNGKVRGMKEPSNFFLEGRTKNESRGEQVGKRGGADHP